MGSNTVFKDKVVLITGGASGIGKIMGRMVLERGAILVIWDIDRKKSEEALSEFLYPGKVYVYNIDVSSAEEIKVAARWVRHNIGDVDILINNAGIVFGKYFYEHDTGEIIKTMDVNANAPMHITKEFLPGMMLKNMGCICNISSMAGLVSNPKMSVYVATKWAMIGWSDSLRLEMKKLNRNIAITTVTPYYIDTGMFKGVRSVIPPLKPEKVAARVISGIEKNKKFISTPWSIRFIRFFQWMMPVNIFDWFIGGVIGMHKTMDHFEGRQNN